MILSKCVKYKFFTEGDLSLSYMTPIRMFVLACCALIALSVNAAEISWEAEKFAKKKGESIKVYKAGDKVKGTPDEQIDGKPIPDRAVSKASGNAFIGVDNGVATDGSWVKYEFSVPVGGDWYFWGKVIAPSVADNSFHWGIDIKDEEAKKADDDKNNIWDFFEKEELRAYYTTDWVWFRLNSRSGKPFPGLELDQYINFGDTYDPTPLNLSAGKHTFHLIDREDGTFIDALFATTSRAHRQSPTAVEATDKLATLWGDLKQRR